MFRAILVSFLVVVFSVTSMNTFAACPNTCKCGAKTPAPEKPKN